MFQVIWEFIKFSRIWKLLYIYDTYDNYMITITYFVIQLADDFKFLLRLCFVFQILRTVLLTGVYLLHSPFIDRGMLYYRRRIASNATRWYRFELYYRLKRWKGMFSFTFIPLFGIRIDNFKFLPTLSTHMCRRIQIHYLVIINICRNEYIDYFLYKIYKKRNYKCNIAKSCIWLKCKIHLKSFNPQTIIKANEKFSNITCCSCTFL